jgi:purine nucleosidase
VWVDTDCGIDDALALMVLHCAGVALVGVSSTEGNTTAGQAAANAAAVLARIGNGACVWSGSPNRRGRHPGSRHGPDGLGGTMLGDPDLVCPGDGVEALVSAAHSQPRMGLLIAGPATNVARALRREPRLPKLLGDVVLVAGSVPGGRDTNTWCDPQATAELLAGWRAMGSLTVVTVAATSAVPIRGTHLARLASSGRWDGLAWQIAETYANLQSSEQGEGVLVVHDAYGAAVLADRSLVASSRTAGGGVSEDHAHPFGPGTIRWVEQLHPRIAGHVATLLGGRGSRGGRRPGAG